eukprot:gene11456-15348_t
MFRRGLTLSINYETLVPTDLPQDWTTKNAAARARDETYAVLLGHIPITLLQVDSTLTGVLGLTKYHARGSKNINKSKAANKSKKEQRIENFNEDGEFHCHQFKQIYISNVILYLDAIKDSGKQIKDYLKDSDVYEKVLDSLFALQSPATSVWNCPFIRIVSDHVNVKPKCEIKFYIYATRYLFELISDSSIKTIMEVMEGTPYRVIPTQINPILTQNNAIPQIANNPIKITSKSKKSVDSKDNNTLEVMDDISNENNNYYKKDIRLNKDLFSFQKYPQLFLSTNSYELQSKEYKFSLGGILKQSENQGYPLAEKDPDGLAVELFDFQKSSYQWMKDQENNQRGLNGFFWEEWKSELILGFNIYYFPLGGEFRLQKPPKSNGGLLCEEMGLGKTVEIIALILGNPMPFQPIHREYSATEIESIIAGTMDETVELPCLPATLIVVPSTLIGQWMKELNDRVKPSKSLRVFQLFDHNYHRYKISLSDIRRYDRMNGFTSSWGCEFDGSLIRPMIDEVVEIRVPWLSNWNMFPNKVFLIDPNNIHVEIDLNKLFQNADIILTGYDILRSNVRNMTSNVKNFLSRYKWHRVVLDECQEIKISTNLIAQACSKLKASNRWMVSGTPLCTSIDDLHGELNFLQIWPFSLPDSEDGFWSLRISKPFKAKKLYSLQLLFALINVVMMRHSKSQRYFLTNQPLVNIPQRVVEWKGFDIENEYELYMIKYMQYFAKEVITNFKQFLEEMEQRKLDEELSNQLKPTEDNSDDGIELLKSTVKSNVPLTVLSSHMTRSPQYNHVKSILTIISKMITYAGCVELRQIDHLRRMLRTVVVGNLLMDGGNINNPNRELGSVFSVMNANNALEILQGYGHGTNGGLNHSSNRHFASTAYEAIEEKARKKFEDMSMAQLKNLFQESDIPQPMVWHSLPFRVNLQNSSPIIECVTKPNTQNDNNNSSYETIKNTKASKNNDYFNFNNLKDNNNGDAMDVIASKSSKKLSDMIAEKDLLRVELGSANDNQTVDMNAISVINNDNNSNDNNDTLLLLGHIRVDGNWTYPALSNRPLLKYSLATRKQSYIDILTTKELSTQRINSGMNNLHEQGFQSIYSLMAGQSIDCPLCLFPVTRPVVTECVHIYCYTCITNLFQQAIPMNFMHTNNSQHHKCPVCRRKVTMNSSIEIDCTNIVPFDDNNMMEENNNVDTNNIIININNNSSNDKNNKAKVDKKRKRDDNSINNQSVVCGLMDENKIISNNNNQQQQPAGKSTEFIIPHFNLYSQAPLEDDLDGILHIPTWRLCPRDPLLPSLSPLFLTAFNQMKSTDNNIIYSSRFLAVVKDYEQVIKDDPQAKFVVYSQYSETLHAFDRFMTAYHTKNNDNNNNNKRNKIFYNVIIDGKVGNHKEKMDRLSQFQSDPICQMCLLTSGSAGTGLTLTIAHVCYMLEPLQKPAEEAQALSRIHRI